MEEVPDFVKGERFPSIVGKFKYLCHQHSAPPKYIYSPLPQINPKMATQWEEPQVAFLLKEAVEVHDVYKRVHACLLCTSPGCILAPEDWAWAQGQACSSLQSAGHPLFPELPQAILAQEGSLRCPLCPSHIIFLP